MRAAVLRDGQVVVDEVPDLAPKPGQVLVRTIACGICGSDLHTVHHGDQMVEMSREAAGAGGDGAPLPAFMDLGRDVVMGHEFCGEVVELGENTGNVAVGDLVVSMPVVFGPEGLAALGYSNDYPGGYAEQMLLSDMLCLKVPNGLDPKVAALTEPTAVGVHAVNRSRIAPGGAAVVLGCGPVGLAVIADLRRTGVETIVASDFSPMRRALATELGATTVVDPSTDDVMEAWRVADGRSPLVIFEAVGVPGMLDAAMRSAPRRSRIVVVGVCMEPDTIRPMQGVVRELTIEFVFAYDPVEFSDTLRAIAEGELVVEPMITGSVAIDGVPDAFGELANPDAQAKILVVP